MFTNTIYLPKDQDFSETVSETLEFYHDKETVRTNRYTCLENQNVDKSRGYKVTITVEPLASKKATGKTATVKKRKKKS